MIAKRLQGMHSRESNSLQTFMLAVFTEQSQNVQNETGPIDDGFIANAVGSLPSDPLCCAGPEPFDDVTACT